MKRTFAAATAAMAIFAAAPAAAQEGTGTSQQDGAVEITRADVATDVVDREPVGTADSFPGNVGQVYFYTVLEGDFPESQFEHVWLHNDEEVARVSLTAEGPRWRTWSRKTITPDMTGDWEVQVVDSAGTVLDSASFTIDD